MAFGQLQDFLGNSDPKRKVRIYPGIRFVDPQSVDQQGPDICGKQLSTFNDIIFNLLLVSLAKVRIKEPASKRLNSTTAVDVDNTKSHTIVKNQKLSTSGGNRGKRLRLHERMALSR